MLGLFRREGEDENRTRIEAARARFLAGPVQPLRRRGVLGPPEPGMELLSAGLGPDLTLVALWAAHRDIAAARAPDVLEDGSVVASGRAPWAYRTVATWHGPAPRSAMIIEDLDLTSPIVQPMPGGGLLAVASRCRLREDGMAERNASIYGPYGYLERNGAVGDGIEDVQVSTAGRIAVSYFGEGVSGANGWSQETTPPIGQAGLVEFSATLTSTWHYAPPRGMPPIADCYAMNLVGESIWACYSTDFPVVCVDEALGVITWQNDVRGASGLLVSASRVGLVGGDGPYDDRLVVGTLDGSRVRIDREARLTLPDGGAVPRDAQALCRNERLIVLVDDEVLGLDLTDFD